MNTPFSPPALPETHRRRWVLPVVVLAIVFLPMLMAMTWFLKYRVSGSSRVEQLEAKIRARGEPVTLADLARTYPPIPDASNGAVALLQIWEEESPDFWQAFRNGARSLPDRVHRTYDEALPILSIDAKYFPRTASLAESNVVAAQDYLKGEREHIESVRKAIRYPQFRFPVQITNGMSALLPHITEVKREAMNFRLIALMATQRGDVDAAIGAMEDMARAGHTLASEPFLISQLVRMACYNMAIEDLERLLSRQSLSGARLDQLDALLQQMRMKGALRTSFIAERAAQLSVYDLPAGSIGMFGNDVDGPSPHAASLGMGLLKFTGIKDADQRLMLETMEEAISMADRDDPESLDRSEKVFREAAATARRFPPRPFSAMLLPGLDRVAIRFATFEARRRAAVVAVELERYRASHNGQLPSGLDAVASKFPAGLPKDPFDGNPLRFHPLATGFVVYSIGANRVDDGGKERPKKGSAKDFDETFVIER